MRLCNIRLGSEEPRVANTRNTKWKDARGDASRRLLGCLLVTLYLTSFIYNRYHLFTEVHLSGDISVAAQQACSSEEDCHHHHDHRPHPAGHHETLTAC